MDLLYSSECVKYREIQQAKIMKIISAIPMLAIIVPVVANTTSHNERFIMDVANSKNVVRCDIGLVFDYIDINDRIFADALDERL